MLYLSSLHNRQLGCPFISSGVSHHLHLTLAFDAFYTWGHLCVREKQYDVCIVAGWFADDIINLKAYSVKKKSYAK